MAQSVAAEKFIRSRFGTRIEQELARDATTVTTFEALIDRKYKWFETLCEIKVQGLYCDTCQDDRKSQSSSELMPFRNF